MATEIVDSLVKVGCEFVLEIDIMLCFSYSSGTYCLPLLITSKRLLRVPSWHLPMSMRTIPTILNYSNNYPVEKGKEKKYGKYGTGRKKEGYSGPCYF